MNPQQEYYLRNKVVAPYIFYGNGRVLLHRDETRSSDRFKLVEVKAINKEGNDGYNIGRFEINVFSPSKGNVVFQKTDDYATYWSNYSDFLLSKIDQWKGNNWHAIERSDLKIMSWELLSYNQDSRFAELSMSLLDLNFQLLDSNIPVETRQEIMDKLLNHFGLQAEENRIYKEILYAWNCINEPLTRYSDWLVKLLNR